MFAKRIFFRRPLKGGCIVGGISGMMDDMICIFFCKERPVGQVKKV
jgi:hypothetical protein